MRFTYAGSWLSDGDAPPLSLAMPPREAPYDDAACRAFFGGLLPEGAVRDHLARSFGISADNDFSLLERIGADCAGAVSLRPPDGPPLGGLDPDRYRWLDEDELAEAIADLPSRPLGIDAGGEIRLSLAGAQDKLPVFCADDDRIGLPLDGAPSSHIIKAPLAQPDSVFNEALCLTLAGELGLSAVEAAPRAVAGQEFLLVRRYDRRPEDGRLSRVHQEDLGQALGRVSAVKYEAEGGPTLVECIRLLRDTARRPVPAILGFVDALTLNVLVGNADAHAKNFSVILDRAGPRLAPLYDVLCSRCYTGLTRKMAMRIGGQDNADWLEPRHWDRLADGAGLGGAAMRRRRRSLASAAPGACARALELLDASGWSRPIGARIEAEVQRRARMLAES